MSLIPPRDPYIARSADYDPQKTCTATKTKVIGFTEIDFVCELALLHTESGAKYHTFLLDEETRVTWL